MGVAAFYLNLRLESAVGLLLAGNKIEFVAGAVGFKSNRAFRSAFHKYRGCTPREFVARNGKAAGESARRDVPTAAVLERVPC